MGKSWRSKNYFFDVASTTFIFFLDLISERYIRSIMDKSKILIFSKFPEIRKVKSRLHPTLVMRRYLVFIKNFWIKQ